jgi:Zn-dependent peptidase ImmA (M78 family)/DNA-binding XRE family transcriptional regulator
MARSPAAHVTPAVLRWARETSGLSQETAAQKISVTEQKLGAAEIGDEFLTLRQAEKAARVYGRNLADLFRPEPPEEEPEETQFRRLPGAPEPPWPPEMKALSRRVRDRQDAAAELYELIEEDPPWDGVELPTDRDPLAAASKARELLGINLEEQFSWQDPAGYAPLRAWLDAIEDLGVLVMQDGTLTLEMMRGFASMHPRVPAIVLNTKDDPRARAFTLVHELGHLLPGPGEAASAAAELWCNRFAAEVLMPAEIYVAQAPSFRGGDPLPRIDAMARQWGVTPLAAAIRAITLNLIPTEIQEDLLARIRRRGEGRESPAGGDYYRNMLSRLGPSFVQLVFTAMEGQALTYPAAAGLLGVKVGNFAKLREQAERRSIA